MKSLSAARLSLFLLIAFSAPVARPQSPDGPWRGAISVMGTELKIVVTYKTNGDSVSATIDIPQQGAKDLPLRNVSWRPPKAHFELPAGPGLAVFDGTIAGDSINGDFQQAGITGTFRLERGKDVRAAAPPAPPEAPPPYREEEVTFNSDSVKIAGTLTVPPGKGRHPAVVLITGSGAHNRDEELLGFKPFLVIADYFTRHGLAVLRCDDRGVGGSTGSKSLSTPEDHSEDMLAAVKFLQGRLDINPAQIGLCGHSEGGIIAPIAAAKSKDVAFIVLIAGPAVTGDKLMFFQIESQMREGKAGEEQIRNSLEEQRRVFDCVRTGKGWNLLLEEFKKDIATGFSSLPPGMRKGIADSAAFVNGRADGMLASIRTPWFRYFIDFDPVPTLEKVSCPVLAIFGALDMQVPVSLNRKPMETALAKSKTKDWNVEVLPKANHLFLTAVTGSPAEYAGLEKKFLPGFLDLMTGWITKRVSVLSGGAGGRGN
jgi:pimeloyl-ACP methyl ester carboxylesterase